MSVIRMENKADGRKNGNTLLHTPHLEKAEGQDAVEALHG